MREVRDDFVAFKLRSWSHVASVTGMTQRLCAGDYVNNNVRHYLVRTAREPSFLNIPSQTAAVSNCDRKYLDCPS